MSEIEFRQMTIFDYLQSKPEEKSLDDIPEEEMVDIIGRRLGVRFEYRDELSGWELNDKKNMTTYHLKYSRYSLKDKNDRFISVGADCRKGGYEGCSGPCDSIEEAEKRMKKLFKKYSVNLLT